jgi:tetratricopeptide (TPR) repeat protein
MFVMVPLIAWFNIGTIKSESLLNYALDLWTIDNPSAKQIEETARIGEKAAKYNPLDFFSAWLAAKTASQMGDTNKALFYFRKALCRNPVFKWEIRIKRCFTSGRPFAETRFTGLCFRTSGSSCLKQAGPK